MNELSLNHLGIVIWQNVNSSRITVQNTPNEKKNTSFTRNIDCSESEMCSKAKKKKYKCHLRDPFAL